jgi:hypothetical protein
MSRWLPFLVGLAVLLGAGIVHGLWTERWQPSGELVEAAARLKGMPDDIGTWKGEVCEQDPEELQLSGAVGHWSRTFTNPTTGDKMLVVLLCGKPARLVVHRPEHCYRSVGYEPDSPPVQMQVQAAGRPAAEFLTAWLTRDEPSGPAHLRLFWSWRAGERWSAPSSPRLAFAREKALYKLYVIHSPQSSAPRRVTSSGDPCIKFLHLLLPILDDTLTPS